MTVAAKVFRARQSMGRTVRGSALVAQDGFSARYDLDRLAGIFSRPTHKLAGHSYVGKILILDTAKGGVASIAPANSAFGPSRMALLYEIVGRQRLSDKMG